MHVDVAKSVAHPGVCWHAVFVFAAAQASLFEQTPADETHPACALQTLDWVYGISAHALAVPSHVRLGVPDDEDVDPDDPDPEDVLPLEDAEEDEDEDDVALAPASPSGAVGAGSEGGGGFGPVPW